MLKIKNTFKVTYSKQNISVVSPLYAGCTQTSFSLCYDLSRFFPATEYDVYCVGRGGIPHGLTLK
jgi:hypothetical protein